MRRIALLAALPLTFVAREDPFVPTEADPCGGDGCDGAPTIKLRALGSPELVVADGEEILSALAQAYECA